MKKLMIGLMSLLLVCSCTACGINDSQETNVSSTINVEKVNTDIKLDNFTSSLNKNLEEFISDLGGNFTEMSMSETGVSGMLQVESSDKILISVVAAAKHGKEYKDYKVVSFSIRVLPYWNDTPFEELELGQYYFGDIYIGMNNTDVQELLGDGEPYEENGSTYTKYVLDEHHTLCIETIDTIIRNMLLTYT